MRENRDLDATRPIGFDGRPTEPSAPIHANTSEDASAALRAGTILSGRYQISRFIARGGMGEVYEAQDLDLGIRVALKTIRPEIASDPPALRRLKQEVLLARSVSHPNVCRIFDFGRHVMDTKDLSFLTMEYLEGETLSQRLEVRGPFSTASALPVVRQLADALGAAHLAGIVHRDFKSANVMLTPAESGERAVIADFGLALATHDDKDEAAGSEGDAAASEIAGTPAYMAPEQVIGKRAGPAADLYSLGVVLYEMVTGTVPFRRPTLLETARARLTDDPPAPTSLVAISPAWETTILRLLARDPAARFSRAADVVRALEGEAPALPTARHSLPAEHDAFIGRAPELASIATALESRPCLLTLFGPGGTGKTRLARRYGWESLGRWPGGVWFCDLTQANNVETIASAVASGLGVKLGARDPVESAGASLAKLGRALVILDNFEQVAMHAPASLGRWIGQAPSISFLATSRERLQIEGETVIELCPLDPDSEAIQLFEIRARAQRPDFTLVASNRQMVREIVHLLEGLPLAIELAAARLRALSLNQLRDRLADRLGLLAGAGRDRHGALRATLDWSWQLLQPWEQIAIAQTSVFEGGFSLEAAEAVLDLSGFPAAPSILDVIQALVDKSWLRARVALDEPRFTMYAMVHDYAAHKLQAACADGSPSCSRAQLEKRHGDYYAHFARATVAEAARKDQPPIEQIYLLERDNLRSALLRAIDREDGSIAALNLVAYWKVLSTRGPLESAIGLCERVAAIPGLEPLPRADVLRTLGLTFWGLGRHAEARARYEEALAVSRDAAHLRSQAMVLMGLANLESEEGHLDAAYHRYEEILVIDRELGDRRGEGTVLANLAVLRHHQGRVEEALSLFQQALAIHREVGNLAHEEIVLRNTGVILMNLGRLDESRECMEAALNVSLARGDRRGEALSLDNLANVLKTSGRAEDARGYYERALAIHREIGNRQGEAITLGNLGALHLNEGRLDEARQLLSESLALHRQSGNRRYEGRVLVDLGDVYRQQGHADEASARYQEALAINREVKDKAFEGATVYSIGMLAMDNGRVEDGRLLFAQAEPLLRESEAWNVLSQLLCASGECHRLAGDLASARSALAEAESFARKLGLGETAAAVQRIAALRKALGEDSGHESEQPRG